MLELKRGGRARVQTEVLEFIALPFPSSKKLKIWSFHVEIVQGRQRYVQKGVMQGQTCCFANLTYCSMTLPLRRRLGSFVRWSLLFEWQYHWILSTWSKVVC